MAPNWFYVIVFEVWIFSLGFCHGLNVTELLVPTTADIRRDFEIKCGYHLENETLQSLKLYVGGSEIFRFIPDVTSNSKILKFNSTKGVRVIRGECSLAECTVSIRAPFGNQSVRCEVSSERPYFYILDKKSYVNVIAEPYYDPVILGVPDHLAIGDTVRLNCTTDLSLPPAKIQWYIDGQLVNDETQLAPHYFIGPDELGLRKSTRTIRIAIRRTNTNVRCMSSLRGLDRARNATILLKVEEPSISMYIAGGNKNHTKALILIFFGQLATLINYISV